MAEDDDVKMQNVDADKAAPATEQHKARAARRRFLRQALTVASGIALAEVLPPSLLKAVAQQVQCNAGQPLIPIGEIKSNGTKLQAVLKIVNLDRMVPTSVVGTKKQMLRIYSGYNSANPSQKWPPDDRTAPGPGPTFRCSIGDDVQITFLNQIDIAKYPNSVLVFSAEEGKTTTGCDEGTTTSDPNWYPKTAGDEFPNCFHASSAANIHFHGTHVTPSTTGDNVLVNIWPNPKVKEADVKTAFDQIFNSGKTPQKWTDIPKSWRDQQMGPYRDLKKGLIGQYDATAPYNGKRGLPEKQQLWPPNQETITQGVWPQFYVGSYPYSFKIPRYDDSPTGVKMGQAPGTHWYHSHKHGSTAINMFNGLSGALIIEDNSPTGYDGKIKAFYQNKYNVNLEQIVLVFQQITSVTNLLSSGAGAAPVLVNGQFTPKIAMRPGQVQLWRMVNANVQKAFNVQFASCNTGDAPPQFKQTAQDGVQLAFANYINKDNGKPVNMAPANRVDALVQAPSKTGLYVLGTTAAPLLFIEVGGTAQPMGFIENENDYPPLPKYLRNIEDGDIYVSRRVVYGWEAGRKGPGRNANNAAPHYTIYGKQFEDNMLNQVMLLDTAEEWTILNETSVPHPFHIHVNPFQIVEIYDPNSMGKPTRFVSDLEAAKKKYGDTKTLIEAPAVWWDNFAIPIAKTDANGVILGPNGYAQTPGYFIMRSRFVDFTGQYVQHCHILAHEDRGMMQLLEVANNKTVTKHH